MNRGLDKIEAENLACERGGRRVFRDLNFAAARGEVLALEGANGAGKTSALRILAGLLPQSGGQVRFTRGEEAVADPEERARFAGWLGHQDGVKAQLSVRENARYAAALYGADGDVAAALERVGLAGMEFLPGQYLSAGQRRRLALARLLLCGRPLWLLDEPLSALDTMGKRLATELIADHTHRGGIAIVATHEPLGVAAKRLTLAMP